MAYLLNSSSIIIPLVPVMIFQNILILLIAMIVRKYYQKWYVRRLGMKVGNLNVSFKQKFLKLLLEGSFDLTFCTLMNLKYILQSQTTQDLMLNFSSFSDLVNSLITFISFFLVVIYLPAATMIQTFRYFKRDMPLD